MISRAFTCCLWLFGPALLASLLPFSPSAFAAPSAAVEGPAPAPASSPTISAFPDLWHNGKGGTIIERLEASVNSTLVLLSDVRKFRETLKLRAQLDPLFAGTTVSSKGAAASDSDIVEFLIDDKLISQQFPVNDAEVEQEINSIQANNHIDRGALKSTLKEQGFSFDDYFELIRSSTSKRNLIDREIRTKVSITDDDVKNYFYNHVAKSTSAPRAYHVKMIVISPSNYKSVSAAKEVADRALKDLKKGSDTFEEVAKRVSDDPSSQTGGDLGNLNEDQMNPLIRDKLKTLKIGEISDVLGDSSRGFFIIKLVDVVSTESDRYLSMKEEIRNQLAAVEYQHQINLWQERQRQTAFIHRAGETSIPGLSPAGK